MICECKVVINFQNFMEMMDRLWLLQVMFRYLIYGSRLDVNLVIQLAIQMDTNEKVTRIANDALSTLALFQVLRQST